MRKSISALLLLFAPYIWLTLHITDHLVALLEFLGIVARIPNYIMGLTVSSDSYFGHYLVDVSHFSLHNMEVYSFNPVCFFFLKVLAWGNSMPDLSGNVTMARKGLGNMAITACFAEPVFSILVGLGCGFGILRNITQSDVNYVKQTPAIRTGFVFCFVNCGLLLVSGLAINKGIIPSRHGYTSLFLYAAYVGTALLLQFLL